ncbi:SRPBCC family protein, partial [Tepidiforma sp.]|uniref:SRPBCC family protein n=1 Tax=Tepidiforma sp. TaxID=2682230 RepID=UPI002618267D
EPGSEVDIELRLGPLRLRWAARHTAYRENQFFCDEQVQGPFRVWRHRHGFERQPDGRCLLTDDVEFSLPLAPVSDWLAGWAVKRMLRKMFAERHARTAAACGVRLLAGGAR